MRGRKSQVVAEIAEILGNLFAAPAPNSVFDCVPIPTVAIADSYNHKVVNVVRSTNLHRICSHLNERFIALLHHSIP
ncbi:unnamed protein product [Anisakis simplex]|uniref:Uncharacterized protein n=1 Tax=Anisakis simplex TaxID=6269 RepID=A0A0M3J8U0_ANISI|nr:unnamed protein product [Anisakis simplex]